MTDNDDNDLNDVRNNDTPRSIQLNSSDGLPVLRHKPSNVDNVDAGSAEAASGQSTDGVASRAAPLIAPQGPPLQRHASSTVSMQSCASEIAESGEKLHFYGN